MTPLVGGQQSHKYAFWRANIAIKKWSLTPMFYTTRFIIQDTLGADSCFIHGGGGGGGGGEVNFLFLFLTFNKFLKYE